MKGLNTCVCGGGRVKHRDGREVSPGINGSHMAL